MTDKVQDDEFMRQYMDTCKGQIEKLASDPNLLQQTLRSFMQMSRQLMAGSVVEGNMPGVVPDVGDMDIDKMIDRMKEMYAYIKSNYRELMKKDASQIQELDDSSRRLRSLVKKLIEKVEAK